MNTYDQEKQVDLATRYRADRKWASHKDQDLSRLARHLIERMELAGVFSKDPKKPEQYANTLAYGINTSYAELNYYVKVDCLKKSLRRLNARHWYDVSQRPNDKLWIFIMLSIDRDDYPEANQYRNELARFKIFYDHYQGPRPGLVEAFRCLRMLRNWEVLILPVLANATAELIGEDKRPLEEWLNYRIFESWPLQASEIRNNPSRGKSK